MIKKLFLITCFLMVVGALLIGCPDGDSNDGGNGGTLTPASFQISNLIITPSEITTGDEITVTVTVTNSGGQQGTCQLTLKIDSITVENKSVSVGGNASKDVSFNADINESGQHQIEVNNLSASVTAERAQLGDSFILTINMSMDDGTTAVVKYWQKGEMIRTDFDMNLPGQPVFKATLIIKDGFVYMYLPDENIIVKYEEDAEIDFNMESFEMFEGYFTENNTEEAILVWMETECDADPNCVSVDIIGHETINSRECTIFEIVNNDGTIARLWMDISEGYIIKMEAETIEGIITMEFNDLDLNADIPDSVFDLPQGVPILDMTGVI